MIGCLDTPAHTKYVHVMIYEFLEKCPKNMFLCSVICRFYTGYVGGSTFSVVDTMVL